MLAGHRTGGGCPGFRMGSRSTAEDWFFPNPLSFGCLRGQPSDVVTGVRLSRAFSWLVRTVAAPHVEPADARTRRVEDRARCCSAVQASIRIRCTLRCLCAFERQHLSSVMPLTIGRTGIIPSAISFTIGNNNRNSMPGPGYGWRVRSDDPRSWHAGSHLSVVRKLARFGLIESKLRHQIMPNLRCRRCGSTGYAYCSFR